MTKNINRKPHCKVTKLKSNFSLILGLLNRALNNPAQRVKGGEATPKSHWGSSEVAEVQALNLDWEQAAQHAKNR